MNFGGHSLKHNKENPSEQTLLVNVQNLNLDIAVPPLPFKNPK